MRRNTCIISNFKGIEDFNFNTNWYSKSNDAIFLIYTHGTYVTLTEWFWWVDKYYLDLIGSGEEFEYLQRFIKYKNHDN